MIAQGNLGAIKAAKEFDGTKGFKFITYLIPWVKQSILKYLTEYGRKIRLPVNQLTLYSNIRKFRENYHQDNGIYPSINEISIALNEKYDNINFLVNILKNVVSMNNKISHDNNSTIGDYIEDTLLKGPTDKLMDESLQINLDRVLCKLPDRDKEIVKMLFGIKYNHEYSLDSVGEKFNITRERVRQIKESALKELRILITKNNVI